jgi:hypothetical protein
MSIDTQKPFDGRVVLRIGRTTEGWRRWYAMELREQPGGWLSESSRRASPGFVTRSEAMIWAEEHGLTVLD